MASISSLFWVAGLIFAVVLAPQLRIWTWGPAMLCFSLSTLLALPLIWRERKNAGDLTIVISGFMLVSWLGIRALVSPVRELSQSDLLLVAMAVSTFVSFKGISTNITAQRILYSGIAALTAASVFVVIRQISDHSYSPIFPRNGGLPSGFYAHYNYGGSFLIAVFPILLGLAIFGKERIAIRLVLALISLAALAAVYYTRSRGAIVGAMGGIGVLLFLALITGKRDRKKWFAPAALAAPISAAALCYALYIGWTSAEEARGGGSITGMLDNTIRFYLASIALSCTQLHPFLGGGARSYSWECYRFWDYEAMGQGRFKPEHVHNELLQTATDYGIIGAGLLVIFLICLVIFAIYRVSTLDKSKTSVLADGWRIGGLAGLAALFIQSNFEGIFRIAPGAVVLAICLSAACFSSSSIMLSRGKIEKAWLHNGLISLAGVVSIVLLFTFGLKGTRVSVILWPSYFSSKPVGVETKFDALNKAISVWPMLTLYRERAKVSQKLSGNNNPPKTASDFIHLSLSDFEKVKKLHPFDPAAFVSSANLLSTLGRNREAEKNFVKAIDLQGEMEAAFQAHFYAALHYQRKALSEYNVDDPIGSLSDMQIAVNHIERAFATSWTHNTERDQQIRVMIHQNYARLLEACGEQKEALEVYNFIAKKPFGRNSYYMEGLLYGKLAVDRWFDKRRPEDALYFFNIAAGRIRAAKGELPRGVTPEQREKHLNYFNNSINTLKSGKIVPSQSVDF